MFLCTLICQVLYQLQTSHLQTPSDALSFPTPSGSVVLVNRAAPRSCLEQTQVRAPTSSPSVGPGRCAVSSWMWEMDSPAPRAANSLQVTHLRTFPGLRESNAAVESFSNSSHSLPLEEGKRYCFQENLPWLEPNFSNFGATWTTFMIFCYIHLCCLLNT